MIKLPFFILAAAAILYAALGFTLWQFDVRDWTTPIRFGLVIFSALFGWIFWFMHMGSTKGGE